MDGKRVMKELFKIHGKPYDKEPAIKSIGNIMYDMGMKEEKNRKGNEYAASNIK